MNEVHLVTQEKATTCGVACVAMCTGWSHTDAMERFSRVLNWRDSKKTFYTTPSNLKKVLDEAKVSYKVCKSGSWSDVEGTAIVGVNRDRGYWHWIVVVKDSKRFLILDPETGELYRHDEWPKEFIHSKGTSSYFRFGDAAKVVCV